MLCHKGVLFPRRPGLGLLRYVFNVGWMVLAKEFMRADPIGDDVQGTKSSDLPTTPRNHLMLRSSSLIFVF